MDESSNLRLAQPPTEASTLRQHLATLGEIALAGELPLDDLLQKIVEMGRVLLNARYAALGVFDSHQRVTHFFTAGLSADERRRIGPLPVGIGLLGLIVQERRIIRSPRIADHPGSSGFPPNHPQMTSFLGGPIARGEKVYGNLYLTDRLDAVEFSRDDELLLSLLASQAAAAIENAQRFASAREDERITQALFEVGRALASMNEPKDMIDLIVTSALRLLDGDLAGLGLRDGDDPVLRWTIVRGGTDASPWTGPVPVHDSLAGRVLETGAAITCDDLAELGDELAPNHLLVREKLRSVVIVPLGQATRPPGVLLLGWRLPSAIPQKGVPVLDRLADRAAIALRQGELHAREQAALRQSQIERSSLEAIFDSLTDGVYTTDLDGCILRVNRRAVMWSGCPSSEAIGRPAADVFRLIDNQWIDVPNLVDPAVTIGEISLIGSNGDRLPVEVLVSSMRDNVGAVIGHVHVLRDLRPQREVERLKANIISLVSHELRTPLSHIKGYASSLLQTDVTWDPETQHDFIASIERQADRLARLIADLLEISRLDAGGAARLELVAISPAGLIERGTRLANLNVGDHSISTSVSGTLPVIMADPSHIDRVLINLIENAAKYSPDGSPITIDVGESGDDVVFSVHDRGTGLTADEKSHMFERFYRSPRVKQQTPGTGLGLAICREIVKAHGGRIWVDSVEGEGSVFRFALPISPRDERIGP